MDSVTASAEALRRQIAVTEEELKKLKEQLAKVESKDVSPSSFELSKPEKNVTGPVTLAKWPLLPEEYKRYGRQMIVPSIGIQGKTSLPFSK